MKYKQAIQLLRNKTDRDNRNISTIIDDIRGVLLINEQQINFVRDILRSGNNSDNIRYIQKLLISNKNIQVTKVYDDRVIAEFPKDYFDISSCYCYAKKGNCNGNGVKLFTFPIKDKNYGEIFSNINYNPDFMFRETPFIVGTDGIHIFKDNFDITDIFITYYRYPKKVDVSDIDGYTDIEIGLANIDMEFDDKVCNMIIDMAAMAHLSANQTK